MSARTRLEFVLLKYFSGSEDVTLEGAGLELERLQASGLVDDFAHELAKQIRSPHPPESHRAYSDSFEGGADWAADLIDPWEES